MSPFIPQILTVPEAEKLMAERLKALRLTAGLKRSTLAARSGVTEASLKRFETTGQVSLKNFLRLAHALGRLPEMDNLLKPPEAASLAELRAEVNRPQRKRGRI